MRIRWAFAGGPFVHMVVAWIVAAAHAGTWVRAPGHGYAQLSGAYTVATARFTEQGRRLPMSDPHFVPDNFEQVFDRALTTQWEASAYLELGVLPELELFGQLPVRQVTARWDFAIGDDVLVLRNFAPGDALLGARWGRRVGGWVVALGASARLPLYNNAPQVLGNEAGNADIYDDRPPVGPGTIDGDFFVAAGRAGRAWWVQLELGLRVRDRQFGALLPLRAQAGARPWPFLATFAEIEAVAPVTDGQAPNDYLDEFNKGPLALDRQAYFRPGVGALIEKVGGNAIPGFLLRVDVITLGRRTSASTTLTAGGTVRW